MSRAQRYQKKDPISHVLDRPDTYVGSKRTRKNTEFAVVDDTYHIERKSVSFSPAILRIFIEPLSNCIDNWARSKGKNKATYIKINIDEKTGETSFQNDGKSIPIEIHEEQQCYVHTMIFGDLHTSENYDDDEDREDISGRNGIGIKATNILSKSFSVEGVDPKKKKKIVQKWKNNMRTCKEPVITECHKSGYTKVTYTPDFAWFNLEGYSSDILSLYKKYLADAAMITGIDVFYNNEKIPVKTVPDYAKLYMETELGEKNEQLPFLQIKTRECRVVITESKEFQAISFANGIYTPLGGTHVDAWTEAVLRPIMAKFNKKGGEKAAKNKPTLTLREVKQFFRFFIVATVKKPEFNAQTKEKLESPVIKAELKGTHLKAICGWPVMDRIEDLMRQKEMGVLKKVERKRKYTRVDNLDSANNEPSTKCSLILVEGLSAKTYATQGIDYGVLGRLGRDYFGIYALRGKVLNCRNATPGKIASNNVVGDIIKALGVKIDTDYTVDANYEKLRYGRIIIITDADCDGIHISGLIQNMFHALFPSLLQRPEPFIYSMQTLIVKVDLGSESLMFYDENEYRKWVRKYSRKNPGKKIKKKYFKGLGTNNKDNIAESFGQKMVAFTLSDHTFENMNKVFHKKYTDVRKEWLKTYDPDKRVLKWTQGEKEKLDMSMEDFINTELIKFSHDDCKRSIPSLMDGLKEGHRKVLFSCFLRNLSYKRKTLKVAQLAGYVAEKSAYHHGENNLLATITGMAAAYVGSNNIPLLFRDGGFGSRSQGGKDAANGRYIFTKLDALTRLIFRPEDDVLLEYREDDGDKVEPYFYVPIIPMVLVNGCVCGIGSGWSSTVPCYNPKDLVQSVRAWMACEGDAVVRDGETLVSSLPEIQPWYRGYTGKIVQVDGNSSKYVSWGRVEKAGKNVHITELPIGVWTDTYKVRLEKWKEEKAIKMMKNHSGTDTVSFTVTPAKGENALECNEDGLKLKSSINLTNMCLFDENDCIGRYQSVDEIIDRFCTVRYMYYVRRKQHFLDALEKDIKFLGNKKRFLLEVMEGKIELFIEKKGKRTTRKTQNIVEELEERGYDKEEQVAEEDENKDNEDDNEDDKEEKAQKTGHGYNYLLRLQFRSITEEKINKLQKEIDSKIKEKDNLEKTSENDLWENDLVEFETAYDKWLPVIEKELKGKRKPKGKKK